MSGILNIGSLQTLKDRLTAARAALLDNLSAYTTARGAKLDNLDNLDSKVSEAGNNTFQPGFKFAQYVPGYYYPPSVIYDTVGGSTQYSANTLTFVPFFCVKTHTFSKIACENTNTGDNGEKLRLGVYQDNAGKPGTLLVDAGEITLNATIAVREITTSIAMQGKTLYWLCLLPNASMFILTLSPLSSEHVTFLGQPNFTGIKQISGGVSATQTYGALPATAPAITSHASAPLLSLAG